MSRPGPFRLAIAIVSLVAGLSGLATIEVAQPAAASSSTSAAGMWSSGTLIDSSLGGNTDAISCPRAGFCAAVDAKGNVLTYDVRRVVEAQVHRPGRWRTRLNLLSVKEILRSRRCERKRRHLRRKRVVEAQVHRPGRRRTRLNLLSV